MMIKEVVMVLYVGIIGDMGCFLYLVMMFKMMLVVGVLMVVGVDVVVIF